MILQALKEYYDRKAADPNSGIAPLGWEWKEIPFLIVIREDGSFVRIEDTREMVGKKRRAKPFRVPQAVKRTVGIASNLLWDNVEYATGVVCKGKPERVAEQHKAFMDRLRVLDGLQQVKSVVAFLVSQNSAGALNEDMAWKEACETCAFVSFKIAGREEPVFREREVVAAIDDLAEDENVAGSRCLVTGETDVIERLHPAIKGVRDANTTGANIVSFNFAAARSFGKSQSYNAPIGKKAAFAYATALNTLLGKDSRQKVQLGDATTVFWASKDNSIEDDFAALFGEVKDNPDANVAAVEALLKSVPTGAWSPDDSDTRFYVLGLSPNAARIAVRFWQIGTVREMKDRFARWFEELQIIHGPKDREHLSLWRLLVSIAPLGKSENIPPILAGAVMRSVLEGTPYPATLLSSAILRVKAERDVTYPRAKLIKAFLSRNNERKITMSLDKDNPDVGYRLGRLFAVLERIQLAANPGINATIRDRFYASASATPAAVFGNLMRLSGHHLSKLDSDKKGLRINLEKLLGEIVVGIGRFPAHLPLEEQGMFAIGYYHQRQDFFAGKAKAESNDAQPTVENALVRSELSL